MEERVRENKSFSCRVCMDYSSEYMDFQDFVEIDLEKESLTYLQCFELVTSININIEQNEYQGLCLSCSQDLKNAFIFLRKAQQAEKFISESIEIVEEGILYDFIEETNSNDGSVTLSDKSSNSIIKEDIVVDEIEETYDEVQNTFEDVLEETEDEPLPPQNDVKTDIQIVKCKKCSYKCKESMLPEHLRREHGMESQFSCHICYKAYKSSSLLNTHLSYHRRKKTRNQSDACSICGKTFATSYYLRQHTDLVHAVEREKLKCDQCDKVYISKNALESHKRIHSGQTLKCRECSKVFSKHYELKIHMRFHSKDYPFKCSLCDRKFAIKGHLRTHMWQHQGLKVQCENCEKQFTSTEALHEHSYVHGKEMPFPCVYCHKSYPSKQKYKVHLAMIHLMEFDEKEHIKFPYPPKALQRRQKLNLVQADSVIKEIEDPAEESADLEEIEDTR